MWLEEFEELLKDANNLIDYYGDINRELTAFISSCLLYGAEPPVDNSIASCIKTDAIKVHFEYHIDTTVYDDITRKILKFALPFTKFKSFDSFEHPERLDLPSLWGRVQLSYIPAPNVQTIDAWKNAIQKEFDKRIKSFGNVIIQLDNLYDSFKIVCENMQLEDQHFVECMIGTGHVERSCNDIINEFGHTDRPYAYGIRRREQAKAQRAFAGWLSPSTARISNCDDVFMIMFELLPKYRALSILFMLEEKNVPNRPWSFLDRVPATERLQTCDNSSDELVLQEIKSAINNYFGWGNATYVKSANKGAALL